MFPVIIHHVPHIWEATSIPPGHKGGAGERKVRAPAASGTSDSNFIARRLRIEALTRMHRLHGAFTYRTVRAGWKTLKDYEKRGRSVYYKALSD